MDVGVQKAGQDDLARHVRLHFAGVGPHAYDQAFGHGNVRMAQLVGKHIDVGGVFQNQIRRFPPGGRIDDAPLFQQLPVDFAGIALRHKTTPSFRKS